MTAYPTPFSILRKIRHDRFDGMRSDRPISNKTSSTQEPHRCVHVAALPFPSEQGTQACLAMMQAAIERAKGYSKLIHYPFGRSTHEHQPSAKLRSGPSALKLAEDVRLWRTLCAQRAQLNSADVHVLAHHVEAALLCKAAGIRRWCFVAHTDLGAELPSYYPKLPSLGHSCLRHSGRALDSWLINQANTCAAVSPQLQQQLEQQSHRQVHYLPIPWPLHSPPTAQERSTARLKHGIDAQAWVMLYAGNLDAYQGWEGTLQVLAQLQAQISSLQLLIATGSDPGKLTQALAHTGLAHRLHHLPLYNESQRREAYACSDAVLIPRRIPGGLPVKMLDGDVAL